MEIGGKQFEVTAHTEELEPAVRAMDLGCSQYRNHEWYGHVCVAVIRMQVKAVVSEATRNVIDIICKKAVELAEERHER